MENLPLIAKKSGSASYPDRIADVQTGNHRLNKTLSARRAQAVADALTAKGIAADRITADSQGDTVQPFATPEENRVTICITADAPGM